MKIIVAGTHERINEWMQTVGKEHENIVIDNFTETIKFPDFKLAVDLNADERDKLPAALFSSSRCVLLCAVKKTLSQMTVNIDNIHAEVAGINALPGFLNRKLKEVSVRSAGKVNGWENIFSSLNWEWRWVADTVGMVTPRILFMIINEACYTLAEGTASKEDIDCAMQLGTAYPKGPLKWADETGIANVYETLASLQAGPDARRYSICPVLKHMYENKLRFF